MFFEFIVTSLATWRLSRFIRRENGPLCFMSTFLKWVVNTFTRTDGKRDGTIAEMMTCNKCLSFWLGICTSALWWWLDGDQLSTGIWLMMPWAVSSVVIGLDYADGIYGVRHKIGLQEEEAFDSKSSCSKKEE